MDDSPMPGAHGASVRFFATPTTSRVELASLRLVRIDAQREVAQLRMDSSGRWTRRPPLGQVSQDSRLAPISRDRAAEIIAMLVGERMEPPWTTTDTAPDVDPRPVRAPRVIGVPDPVGLRVRLIGVACVVVLVLVLQLVLSHGWI